TQCRLVGRVDDQADDLDGEHEDRGGHVEGAEAEPGITRSPPAGHREIEAASHRRSRYPGCGSPARLALDALGPDGSPRILESMIKRPPAGTIPEAPGSYQFKDANGRVIYVGKAANLRQRLSNYFAD